MKVIIAGLRHLLPSLIVIDTALKDADWIPTEIVSGAARGVDQSGEGWALTRNIPLKQFPAQWDTWGRVAGFLRNEQMAEYADALLAIWDGHSHGTNHMISTMENLDKPVHVVVL